MKWDPFGLRFMRLKMMVGSLAEAASGHKGNGLPPGIAEYTILNEKARKLVVDYCNKRDLPEQERQVVWARLPVLKVMDHLTHEVAAPPEVKRPGWGFFVFVLVLLPWVLAAITHYWHWVYHLIGG